MAKNRSAPNGRSTNGRTSAAAARAGPNKRKEVARQWSSTHTFAIIGVSCAVLACLLGIAYQYYYSDRLIRMSAVLRNHANAALLTIEQKYKMDAFLLDDPLADVVKTKLRPVQERIASLRTQCSQYEKMGQIAGGPTQFIESSLQEINTNLFQRIAELNTEAMSILAEYADRSTEMAKAAGEMLRTTELRMNKNDLTMLTIMGEVHLFRNEDTPAEEVEKAKQNLTLERVTDLVEELANMYEGLEEIGLKLNEMSNGLGLRFDPDTELTDEEYDLISPYMSEIMERRKKIDEFKKANDKYMQLFHELTIERHRELMITSGGLQENFKKRRQPYMDLYLDVLRDTDNLKIRIDNLRHAYAKRKPKN